MISWVRGARSVYVRANCIACRSSGCRRVADGTVRSLHRRLGADRPGRSPSRTCGASRVANSVFRYVHDPAIGCCTSGSQRRRVAAKEANRQRRAENRRGWGQWLEGPYPRARGMPSCIRVAPLRWQLERRRNKNMWLQSEKGKRPRLRAPMIQQQLQSAS